MDRDIPRPAQDEKDSFGHLGCIDDCASILRGLKPVGRPVREERGSDRSRRDLRTRMPCSLTWRRVVWVKHMTANFEAE